MDDIVEEGVLKVVEEIANEVKKED